MKSNHIRDTVDAASLITAWVLLDKVLTRGPESVTDRDVLWTIGLLALRSGLR